MIILFYYFFLALYNIAVATIAVWRAEAFENVVTEHFTCEALGSLSTEVCTKDGFHQFAFDSFSSPIHYVFFCSIYTRSFLCVSCKLTKDQEAVLYLHSQKEREHREYISDSEPLTQCQLLSLSCIDCILTSEVSDA